jgi:hypothetical protein
MRIRTLLFNLMRIRIQLPKIILIHADPDPDPQLCFLLIFYSLNVPLIASAKAICKLGFT